jgi:hypothetical protein
MKRIALLTFALLTLSLTSCKKSRCFECYYNFSDDPAKPNIQLATICDELSKKQVEKKYKVDCLK